MRRECHGHPERTAAAPGLFQIGEQRVHHLHDGPRRRRQRDQAPGGAVQDVGGDGGAGGGGAPDRLHHRALPLPEHVHLAGKGGGVQTHGFWWQMSRFFAHPNFNDTETF